MAKIRRFSSLLLVAALMLVLLLDNAASAGLPAGEHIGTPAKEHVHAAGHHIGTPAKEHVDTKAEHIGTPASPAPEHVSPHLASLTHPHLAAPAANELQARGRHHAKARRQSLTNGKVTFYHGRQLLHPACPGAHTPTDQSMTAAISFDSPFHCGDRIRISDAKGKNVVVTAVDRCAGCTRDWIDVTEGVFRVFSGLRTGELHGLTFSKI
ncbi:conserved hypothetical protein [Sporisorium reilianum SRZ2]|uniref:RlpA-like protein double-psi beta-barrel domain-containing protein n=1 Tax=Sporisorium reilianum (strain SRZ2) TaxID=999809 RepID=E6ZQF9_SPORE|nr:conserved hypothetical protein [Sporisorium reilianum SRZ2]